jgi:PPOX class probable F420-dependent enzyme
MATSPYGVRVDPDLDLTSRLTDAGLAFLAERHLGTAATLRRDGTPHLTPVGFTVDLATSTAWIITDGGSAKARHARVDPRIAVSQTDGARWLTLEGLAEVHADADHVAAACERYTARYRTPRVNPDRVAIGIRITRVLGSSGVVHR